MCGSSSLSGWTANLLFINNLHTLHVLSLQVRSGAEEMGNCRGRLFLVAAGRRRESRRKLTRAIEKTLQGQRHCWRCKYSLFAFYSTYVVGKSRTTNNRSRNSLSYSSILERFKDLAFWKNGIFKLNHNTRLKKISWPIVEYDHSRTSYHVLANLFSLRHFFSKNIISNSSQRETLRKPWKWES